MDIRFQRTELVDAPPRRMFGVLTGALGLLLRPVLWRMFNQLNCAPFIHAAQARSSAGATQGPLS